MALFQDEDLLDALIERRLAPLAGCPRRQREVFTDTLLAWLPANGNANAVAAALHIHPQTARHRFRQLTRLFGDALHDGEAMFELQIALRAERARRRAEAG
jgi:DNA-binding PucR family transcriptional regulator